MFPAPAKRSELGPSGDQRKRAHPTQAQHLTVSQVSQLIKNTLEQRIPSPLRVVGQVSNLSTKDHWYFSLKDEAAVLNCVAWATAVRKFGFTPKDGDEVIAAGHISHFASQGRTQMYVSELVPIGAGALELRFRALCEELRGLGYFDEARKKPLPVFPRRIAVITSATGAAVQDVINTAAQRCKAIGLLVVDVRVQGDGAAEEVARAIRWVDRGRRRFGVDAMLVTRGGGSIEDLWAFNERIVADAVFACTLPVVAAIGHESDTTIIELVADVRASTPTQAVMRLIPSSEELGRQIDHFAHRLGFMLNQTVERAKHRTIRMSEDLRRIIFGHVVGERARVERLSARLAAIQPRVLLAQRHVRLAVSRDHLHHAIAGRLRRVRDHVAGLFRQLSALDPHGVLRRGYSLTTRQDRSLIRSAKEVTRGEPIITMTADGLFGSVVDGRLVHSPFSDSTIGRTDQDSGKAATPESQRPVRPSSSRKADPPQMDLFLPTQ